MLGILGASKAFSAPGCLQERSWRPLGAILAPTTSLRGARTLTRAIIEPKMAAEALETRNQGHACPFSCTKSVGGEEVEVCGMRGGNRSE